MEPVDAINARLVDHYGLFEDGRPNWRLVWSTGITEKALTEWTKDGFELLKPEIVERLKYPFDQDRWILEFLTPVPNVNIKDLTEKTSYEPLWTFQDNKNNPTEPDWDVIKFFIDKVQVNKLASGKTPVQKKMIDQDVMTVGKIMEQLFGNDTKISDALAMDSAVGYGTRKRHDS